VFYFNLTEENLFHQIFLYKTLILDSFYHKPLIFKKMKEFRQHHLIQLLQAYEEHKSPLDVAICHYFRSHKSLGSKDRADISDRAYQLIRWLPLIDFLAGDPSWEKRIELLNSFNPLKYVEDCNIPIHIRLTCPLILYQLLLKEFGEAKSKELCLVNNQPAPTTIRVNISKISREELFDKWKDLYDISLTKHSEWGITFHKKIHFFSLPEFKEGFFEIQDEGSQLLSKLMEVEPQNQVLDYCSGSGGKTLAFAPRMQGKGQIYLHDIRQHALLEAKKRLKRAGIQNAQIISAEAPHLKKLKKQMDWVLVDAPCSGTGTLRRNPDMKENFSDELLQRLVKEQRVIFEKALSFLKPGGRIVYATCSVLRAENHQQIEHFLQTYPLKLVREPFQTLPAPGQMDGFFAAVLTKGLRAGSSKGACVAFKGQ